MQIRTTLTVLTALVTALGVVTATVVRAEVPAANPALPRAPFASVQATHYEIHQRDWADSARSREVPVRLYLPAHASADKPVPLIVFSHGIGGSRNGYSYLGSYWASHGYASLHVQHVGSDRALWYGNPFSMAQRLMDAAQENEAIHRARDVSFALDQVLRGEFSPRLDAQRIVAAGHSYGANTTLLLAGARVEREGGRIVHLRDARVKAAMVLSAPPFYGEKEPRKILEHVQVPILHVTNTEDVIRVPGYYSGAGDRIRVYEATGSAQKWLAVFEGGSHSIFTDRIATGGEALNLRVKAATQALSGAFLRQVFEGAEGALAGWHQAHKPMLAKYQEGR
jgi:predicted dienelactone hydrolase